MINLISSKVSHRTTIEGGLQFYIQAVLCRVIPYACIILMQFS